MKILYHHRTQSKDGQAVHIHELIDALRGEGCEVFIVEPPAAAANSFGSESKAVSRARDLLPRALYETLELGYSVIAFWRLVQAYRRHRPDVLYERHNLFLLAGAWLKRLYGVPYLLEVNSPLFEERDKHGGLSLRSIARWTERHVWRTADQVLPVTSVLGGIIASEGVPLDRITVIPNGINERAFARPPDPEVAKRDLGVAGKIVLGFTGFVRDWHGLDGVIDFMATVPELPLVLLVVGDGPARSSLEAQARTLGLADRLRFTGVVDRDAIPSHVSAFDIALQPASTPYASPLKAFEYMALGRAILAPAQPNILEILDDQRTALLFRPGDREHMCEQLRRLIDDAALRERLGAAARDCIHQRGYTWSGNAKRVLELARRIIAARSGALARRVKE